MTTKDRFNVGMSTDFMGAVWTDPEQFSRVVPRSEFPAVRFAEVVGVGSLRRVSRLVRSLVEQGVTPSQIHSATGSSGAEPWYDKVKIRLIHPFIITPFDAAAFFPKLAVVMHAPEAKRVIQSHDLQSLRHAHVLVEQHDPNALGAEDALLQARKFRARHIRAHVLVDVGHFTRWPASTREFNQRWKKLVAFVGEQTQDPNGLVWEYHLPQGTNSDDSLPDRLTHSQRTDFLSATGSSVKSATFEYQRRELLSLIYMNRRDEQKERIRIGKVLHKWGNAGLFD